MSNVFHGMPHPLCGRSHTHVWRHLVSNCAALHCENAETCCFLNLLFLKSHWVSKGCFAVYDRFSGSVMNLYKCCGGFPNRLVSVSGK